MSTSRLHPHHSLPAPVVHATFSTPQSKSHVLAGVQDAYWSDDEVEDAECPLCLEEMDISDLNFKPCICGYQICRFCWHHIKENLNKRCPACRRVYTDDAVEFKPIATQDHKRLTQQKKQRDRERKDLEALGRRHLANVRVVQRNIVYVVGIGPRFAKEELIPTLRSNEYFGQYGKITKILLVKRNSPGGGGPVVGLYITYHRREDAARAIAAVDGTASPGGGRDVMRASYGTTKYCMAFLRGLPRAASWGQKGSNNFPSTASNINSSPMVVVSNSSTNRQTRRTGVPRTSRNVANAPMPSIHDVRPGQAKSIIDRKGPQGSPSRPSTPVILEPIRTSTASELKTARQKEPIATSQLPSSSAPSVTTGSEIGILLESTSSVPIRPDSADSSHSNLPIPSSKLSKTLLVPPGLPAPPGLLAPPGIPSPSRPPRADTTSPQTPLLASQTSYQMSTAARALLDDVKARRESAIAIPSAFSPFPDFDRTLQTLRGEDGGGFSFNLDPKVADGVDSASHLLDFDVASAIPFHGSYMDAFPALRSGSPYMQSPSIGYAHPINHPIYDPSAVRAGSSSLPEKQTVRGTGYLGSFNPFSDPPIDTVPSSSSSPLQRSQHSPVDEDRKVSRFGFARGRQNSTATSSPLHSISPLSYSNDPQPFYQLSEEANPMQPWPPGSHDPHSSSSHSSLLPQISQAQAIFTYHHNRVQPINGDLSEAQLRSFIQSSQERENSSRNNMDFQQNSLGTAQPFDDPAIMSASFVPAAERIFTSGGYGPPPGLSLPQKLSRSPATVQTKQNGVVTDGQTNGAQGELLLSYLKGREASVPSAVLSQCGISTIANDSSCKLFHPPRFSRALHRTIKNFKSALLSLPPLIVGLV
ncbi:hypothetical protein GALMADRAFT_60383 [Galerina marginata CBS 339.88]|uniref:RING-type domain-containing protein n=1 Tax=Galerina marginata (strain CBS 339.88) TaxID=685588 RepID=A0A067TGN8_GALM3|nr:hypothetical protein GALMADRAFT_60383 [Galerina marginata CBS 339.88]